MEDKIYLGKITSTHGIKGELKILSDFERKEIVFKKGFGIYIDDKKFTITSYRPHKNFDMVTIDNILDINLVYQYVKKDVYIKRSDLNLRSDEYLLGELIGFKVYDKDLLIGTVKEIRYNKVNKFLYCIGDKDFYIPILDVFIESIDVKNGIINTINGSDLII